MGANRKIPHVARLYHSHSSHIRSRLPDATDDDHRPPFQFRTYPGSERVDLPGRDFDLSEPLGNVLRRRKSVREYVLQPLDLTLVGRLFHASFGVRGERKVEGGGWVYDRPSPSAGGLYPLELYVATQAVAELPDGLYHYDARAHQLEVRGRGLLHQALAEASLAPDAVRHANLVIMIAGMFQRTMWKYGERGYRYVHLDAGHLGQNLYLVATALGLGAIGIGGFFDEELNHLAGLTAGEEEVIYLMCIGQPGSTDAPNLTG
jgi:SagB-type dehydrogenase family enzyme